jgi:DNA-binding protein
VRHGRQQGARDALETVHRSTEQAGRAIAKAVEVSEELRAALLREVEAIALRVVALSHVANQAADVHTAAQRLGVGGRS